MPYVAVTFAYQEVASSEKFNALAQNDEHFNDLTSRFRRTAAGIVSASAAPALTSAASIAFPAGRFTSPPRVAITPESPSALYSATVTEVTAAGCTAVIRRIDGGGSISSNVPVHWVAVQDA